MCAVIDFPLPPRRPCEFGLGTLANHTRLNYEPRNDTSHAPLQYVIGKSQGYYLEVQIALRFLSHSRSIIY